MIQRYNAHLLVLVVAVSLILFAACTADAQYLWLDTNGDGLNWWREFQMGNTVPGDCLNEKVTSIDVYLATDLNPDGTPATCMSGGTFTINSYQATFRFSSGTLVFNGWTDAMGFNTPFITAGDGTFATNGSEAWVGRSGQAKPPGTYRLGTLSVTVTGDPTLNFVTSGTISPDAYTTFGSDCSGDTVPGMLFLGAEFPLSNAFGTCFKDPVLPTTWGKIKQTYR